ncbi:MAG: DUF4198 domain-containing protein [Chitinophagaceae bacterium]|nr:DUF4198 domain-containing protein [Chitinophagaceae bacterium]
MKRPVLIVAALALVLLVYAHEFWLQPQKFYFTVREIANIRFQVGEHFSGENWGGGPDKVQQLIHYAPSGVQTDLALLIKNQGDSVQLPLREEGTHMLVFNSTSSFIRLEADKFNQYLAEEGLQEALQYRRQHHELQVPGREYYQRSVKTIFQAGSKITDSCIVPSILPLDVIPEENPYMVPIGSNRDKVKVRFQVLFYGQPLYNALVKCSYYRGTTRTEDTGRTNRRGLISFDRHPGPNLLSCVHMERNLTDTVADWQSYWGSLSFDYSQFFPGRPGR